MAISVEVHGKICSMMASGWPPTTTALMCNVSRKSVYNIWEKYNADPNKNIPVPKKQPG